MDKVLHVSDDSFEQEILNSKKPSLVDFWAAWCGPCKAIGPVIEELATEYGDQVNIAKMNVDENPKTPAKYGINAIPTLILFKDGKAVEQIVGVVSKAQIEETIKKVI